MKYRILLVNDQVDILEFVSYNLLREGYEVYTASNGREALQKALEIRPHLVLLDVMMPVMDGMTTCTAMRSHRELKDTLIIFLSARSEDQSQIDGFEHGADDYITKPIKVKILVSRIKAMLKRIPIGEEESAVSNNDTVTIDRERFTVKVGNREMVLPRKEFQLLALLYSKPQKVFSREDIYSGVWGNKVVVGDRTIDVHIRKLRSKIGDNHIVTIKGVGYKYQ